MSAALEEVPPVLDVAVVSRENALLVAQVVDLWRASLNEPLLNIDLSTDVIIAGTYNSELASAAQLRQERGCIYAVSRLVTAQAFQRLGLGSEVLHVAEDTAVTRGGQCMQLIAPLSAISFFEGKGYHRTGIGIADGQGKGLRHQMQKVIN